MLVDLDISFLKMTPKNCLTPPYRLLRPKKGSTNYFFKFSYTAFLNNHPKMVSIKNQPIWTKIEDLHTFFVFFFMENGEIAPRISVFGLKNSKFSKYLEIL